MKLLGMKRLCNLAFFLGLCAWPLYTYKTVHTYSGFMRCDIRTNKNNSSNMLGKVGNKYLGKCFDHTKVRFVTYFGLKKGHFLVFYVVDFSLSSSGLSIHTYENSPFKTYQHFWVFFTSFSRRFERDLFSAFVNFWMFHICMCI